MSNDPKEYQLNLNSYNRPGNVSIEEKWYPKVKEIWPSRSTRRIYNPIEGIRAIVIHATAGYSSFDAVKTMRDKRSSFHWLIPDENEPQHGHFVWACIPETLAAWHVRNACCHPDVWNNNKRINHWSLGIEIVNLQRTTDEFSQWQVEMTARIVRYCWAKYPNLTHIVSHASLDPTRRTDPGVNFPWLNFVDLVLNGDEDVNELVEEEMRKYI